MKNKLLIVLTILFFACSNSDNTDNGMVIPQDNYRYFRLTVDLGGTIEKFLVRTSNSETLVVLDNLLSLPKNERALHINGKIARGNNNYNYNWSWHFKDNEWTMVELSVELCDASPSFVENNLDYFISNINGSYCPWDSILDKEMLPGELIE
ncbi:MAG: hypothetical protein L3J45_01530 [Flavobacteriaceae bacterium]|nr:hypothetical protein [Flavobacteriaceae bacterium]